MGKGIGEEEKGKEEAKGLYIISQGLSFQTTHTLGSDTRKDGLAF